jgi:hypothetical protein
MGRKILHQLGGEIAAAKTAAPAGPLSNLNARA